VSPGRNLTPVRRAQLQLGRDRRLRFKRSRPFCSVTGAKGERTLSVAMTAPSDDIRFRIATSADVPAMAACRLTDPAAGPADSRMEAYFDGRHHPRDALAPRIGYVALVNDTVIGYIAGHQTTRHACGGEVQYLFVAPEFRRRGVATSLLRLMADWFVDAGALKVCVCVDGDSPAARPFYESVGASSFKRFWYAWDDISAVRR
jgi:GNAT superfamily N-acetyltransferase